MGKTRIWHGSGISVEGFECSAASGGNDKWYGVILSVAGSKLGVEDDNIIYVINLKSDPMLIGSLRGQKGYFPAYHMNKEKWISVLLGDAGLDEPIKNLLALSYELTAPKKKKNTSK